ncbi:cytochrome c oxidase assembly protein subunit 15 [Salibacterium salarium]|uniref:COX15/CtaA family protein n=1 Tax=Salibacterium salarium TaxID=284579 RepID=UPI002785E355|nr:heme A synthase [Salibacterium salarium]MDQ0298993.1 cytochrome c oxidase assembly protein subunit 15 [Salibacterium salarium]
MHKGLKIFGIITSIGMLIVLLQGALVTKTGSGDGCGATWPLCFGELVPQTQTMETLIEYTHRAWSGLMGLFVIILAIWSWNKLSHMRETKFMALMAVLFIIFQGLMGAGAVIWGNSDIVLALHFGISAISFASVVLLNILAFEDKKHAPVISVSRKYRNYLFFVLIYCYIVIYTGAYVKHTDATYVCSGFPLCNNEFLPDLNGTLGYQIGIQLTHRIAAISLSIVILILWIWTISKFRHYKSLVWGSTAVLVLVIIQGTAGVSILYANTYLTPALFHSLTISILFTVLCYLGMVSTRKKSY